MRLKTKDLIGAALDYAVAVAEGRDEIKVFAPNRPSDGGCIEVRFTPDRRAATARFDPSINWWFGGPIIAREKIGVFPVSNGNSWCAQSDVRVYNGYGPTPLVAAMRCFVASKLGDEVEAPDSLS